MKPCAQHPTLELYPELAQKGAHFKRIWEGWSRFRSEQVLWFRVAEAGYDNFVSSSATAIGTPGKK